MSTPTDPAARLTAAAAHLRTLLVDPELTEGPWLSLDHGDRLLRNKPGDADQAPVYVVNEPMSNGANAAWIAAMHPGVGEKLAQLLETEARVDTEDRAALAAEGLTPEVEHRSCTVATCTTEAALALADAILGGGQ